MGLIAAYIMSPVNTQFPATPDNFTTVPEDVEQWMVVMDEVGAKRAYELFAQKHAHKSINVTHDSRILLGKRYTKPKELTGLRCATATMLWVLPQFLWLGVNRKRGRNYLRA